MKDFRATILIIIILITGSVINSPAQGRQERTSSARAAYGVMPEPMTHRAKKKQKSRKNKIKQVSRAAKDKNPAYRRRNAWAS